MTLVNSANARSGSGTNSSTATRDSNIERAVAERQLPDVSDHDRRARVARSDGEHRTVDVEAHDMATRMGEVDAEPTGLATHIQDQPAIDRTAASRSACAAIANA